LVRKEGDFKMKLRNINERIIKEIDNEEMKYNPENKILHRKCAECEKGLVITINEDGSYTGGNYYGTIKLGIGNWTAHKLEDGKFKRCIPIWKYIYFKLSDMKKLLLRQYENKEIWICDECDR
jgi:hypothetical protein